MSKTIIINESQLDVIAKSLNEAALPSFSLEELSKIQSFRGKQQYCVQNLGKAIGNGSSRQVFQIDDEKVLKLAKNNKGLAQNEYEGQDDYYKESLSIFPKVFDKADDYSWLISEYVLPAKEKDFQHCLGMSFNEWCSVIRAIEINCRYQVKQLFWVKPIENEKLWELCDNNETVYEFNDYIGSYDTASVGDLYVIQNYGLALRNNQPQIIILDSGLSEEIWNTHYRR